VSPFHSSVFLLDLYLVLKNKFVPFCAYHLSDPLLTTVQTAPVKKLPAFYVLDSIVKNVGTPYTLFFGRNLYSTFMESYALVDNNTRRKMEEMLKTWKEPVPGSIDTRPVFPIEVTRPIETALIKARTAALQSQQEYARSQPQALGRARPPMMGDPYRNTPTPPNGFRPPPVQQPGYGSQAYPQDHGAPPYPQQSYGTPQVCYYTPETTLMLFADLTVANRESAVCFSTSMAAAGAGV
jgi:pre-mRNA cleavage complex 2 protein Pcf11